MSFNDLSRITRETIVNHVEYHKTLESTNQLAVELLSDLLPVAPALILTEKQTAGRGRGSNSWWATPGALTFSLVIRTDDLQLSADRIPLISLVTGQAVRRVLAEVTPQHSVGIKWPNDVMIGDRKVCGILTEQRTQNGQSALIIGIGVNANNSLAAAPDEFRQRATSVFDVTGESHDLIELLISLLQSIDVLMKSLQSQQVGLLVDLNRRNILRNKRVGVQSGDTLIEGVCQGIDDKGRLIVDGLTTQHRITAGTVVRW